jgi:thiamine biosynthesis protein ThiS
MLAAKAGAKVVYAVEASGMAALAARLVEHNGLALHRSEWPSARLAEGDRIEILQVAAGG